MEVYPLSTELDSQALVITVRDDYKRNIQPQSSLSHPPQNTTHFTEIKASLTASSTTLNAKMETQEGSSSAFSSVKFDSKSPQRKRTCGFDFLTSPKRKLNFL